MVSTYICTGTVLLFVLVCIPGTSIFFILGHIHSCTRFTAVYAYMCNYSGMYVELVYMYDPSQLSKVANPIRGQLAEQGK